MDKIKYTCGIPTQAICVTTEVTPNQQSSLVNQSCLDQEEVNQDIYDQLGDIWSEIDLSALGELCLDYTLESGKIIVKNVLLKYEQEICELKTEIEAIKNTQFCDMNISECGLDFSCLTDACSNDITTVKDLLQALITKSCTP